MIRTQRPLLYNGITLEQWPTDLLRAAHTADARQKKLATHVLRDKQSGRYLATVHRTNKRIYVRPMRRMTHIQWREAQLLAHSVRFASAALDACYATRTARP